MKNYLQLKAQLIPGSRKADGSVTIKFVTAEEIDSDKFAEIDSWRKQNGWLMFKPNEFNDTEVPKADAQIEGQKSKSYELRTAIWQLYKQKPRSISSEAFYNSQMEIFIQSVKNKLD